MKKQAQSATREAAGCFCMLILGALMTLGTMVIIIPGLVAALAGRPPVGLWRSVWIWLVAPGVGIALVGWLTYGLKGRSNPPRRR
jgi:hypothetical protein